MVIVDFEKLNLRAKMKEEYISDLDGLTSEADLAKFYQLSNKVKGFIINFELQNF